MVEIPHEAKSDAGKACHSAAQASGSSRGLLRTGVAYKIVAYSPEDWSALENDLMKIEKACYGPHGDMAWWVKKKEWERKGAIALLAKVGDRAVGEVYGLPLSSFDDPERLASIGGFEEIFSAYAGRLSKVLYINSLAVLPEYRKSGIGTELKRAMLVEARRAGHEFVVGHAKEGDAIRVNLRLGAKVIKDFPNLNRDGCTHYLYVIDLGKLTA